MAGVKMSTAELPLIDDIRAASRQMVRELGFMEATLAATDYPPSAVHAILQIGIRGPLVRKLIESDELKETLDANDARVKPLALTAEGKRTLAALHEFGRRQVSGALSRLTEAERGTVRDGLMLYARALKADRAAAVEL
jgi:hypothetical protein